MSTLTADHPERGAAKTGPAADGMALAGGPAIVIASKIPVANHVEPAMADVDRKWRKQAVIELAILGAMGLVLVILAARFEWFEALNDFAQTIHAHQFDEVILTISFIAVGLAIFAFRRWRESESELTSRRHAEAALRAARNELEHRVERRTAELANANGVLCAEIAVRTRAEETSRDAKERYRALFDYSRDCVYICDFGGRLLDVNAATVALLGYSREELLRMGFADILEPDQLVLVGRRMDEVRKTGIQSDTAEFKLRNKSGGYVEVESNASLVRRDGKPHALQGVVRDITERKRAEAALRRSEEHLRMAAQVAGVGTFDHDLAKGASYSSPTLLKMLGGEQRGTNSFETFLQRLLPEDRAKFLADSACSSDPAGDGHMDHEHRIRLPDGSIRWLHAQSQTWFAGEGAARRAVRVVGVVSDTTAHRQSDETIRRLADIVASSNDAIIGESLDGTVTSWNPAAEKTFGYSAAEMIGRPLAVLLPPDLRHEDGQILARIGAGETLAHHQTSRLRKDGTLIEVEGTLSPIKDADGTIVGASKITRDITARKRTEEALRASEVAFRTLAESMPQIVWITRPDGWTIYFNQQWMDYTGLSLEESLGRSSKHSIITPRSPLRPSARR